MKNTKSVKIKTCLAKDTDGRVKIKPDEEKNSGD